MSRHDDADRWPDVFFVDAGGNDRVFAGVALLLLHSAGGLFACLVAFRSLVGRFEIKLKGFKKPAGVKFGDFKKMPAKVVSSLRNSNSKHPAFSVKDSRV